MSDIKSILIGFAGAVVVVSIMLFMGFFEPSPNEINQQYILSVEDDLKHYLVDYNNVTGYEKQNIQQQICNRYTDVKIEDLSSRVLRQFLYKMRGY